MRCVFYCRLAEPSQGQLELEALLLAHLDGALGDAVAALPSDQRMTKVAALAGMLCALALEGLGQTALREMPAKLRLLPLHSPPSG